MRTKGNIRLSLQTQTPPTLLMLMRHVTKSLTGNANYPNPPVSLADMATLGNDLEAAIHAGMQGGLAERERRNALVEQAKAVLTKTGNYVRAEANGDRVKLSTSGFGMARIPETVGLPLVPMMKSAMATARSGEVDIRWSFEKGSSSHRLMKCLKDPATDPEWVEVIITTRTRHLVTGLAPLQNIWFAVSAMGPGGETALSEPILVRPA